MLIRFAFVILLAALLTHIGTAAKVPDAKAGPPAMIFDADYVQGLAKRGIAKLPGYKPPRAE